MTASNVQMSNDIISKIIKYKNKHINKAQDQRTIL